MSGGRADPMFPLRKTLSILLHKNIISPEQNSELLSLITPCPPSLNTEPYNTISIIDEIINNTNAILPVI
jgi:hypothetical protein